MTDETTTPGESADGKPYVSIANVGPCRVCGESHDLRMGACFHCADFVAGEKVTEHTHRLWDARNPSNQWYYSDDHN